MRDCANQRLVVAGAAAVVATAIAAVATDICYASRVPRPPARLSACGCIAVTQYISCFLRSDGLFSCTADFISFGRMDCCCTQLIAYFFRTDGVFFAQLMSYCFRSDGQFFAQQRRRVETKRIQEARRRVKKDVATKGRMWVCDSAVHVRSTRRVNKIHGGRPPIPRCQLWQAMQKKSHQAFKKSGASW